MQNQKQINRFVGKCKISSQIFLLLEYKESQQLQWEHVIDIRIGETVKRIKQFGASIKMLPLPYIHPDYKFYETQLIEKCQKKYAQRMSLPEHSRKIQKIVGKARINKFLHMLVQWKDYPNSQATWILTTKMWNFFRPFMKVFGQQNFNRSIPFVLKGFQMHLSSIHDQQINSEQESNSEKPIKNKKFKKLMKQIPKKLETSKIKQSLTQDKQKVENINNSEVQQSSNIIVYQQFREQDSLGELSTSKQMLRDKIRKSLNQPIIQEKSTKIKEQNNKVRPTFLKQNKNSSTKIIQNTIYKPKFESKKQKNKIIPTSLSIKEIDQTNNLLTTDFTENVKIQDRFESLPLNKEDKKSKSFINGKSSLKIALNQSQQRQIFQNKLQESQNYNNLRQKPEDKSFLEKRYDRKKQPHFQNQRQIVQISLQCEDVPAAEINENPQNLYRVILNPDTKYLQNHDVQDHKLKKETTFLLTSQMIERYPKQFVKYLETQLKYFSKQKN